VQGNLSRAEHYRKLAVKYHELGQSARPSYLGDFYRGVAVRYVFMAQEASERESKEIGFVRQQRVRPEPFNPQGEAEDPAIDDLRREEVGGDGPVCTREPREERGGRDGLRSTSTVMGALAFGFALGLVVRYGVADVGPQGALARLSDLETISSTSLDLQQPYGLQRPSTEGTRLASLEMPVSGVAAEDIDPPASASTPNFFGDRLLPGEHLVSFDERYGGAVVFSDTARGRRNELADAGRRLSPDLREKATGQFAISRSAPKPSAASVLPSPSTANKQVRTADLSQDLSSLSTADSHTAVYDIAAHTVYMPSGLRLEAHSGLGNLMDDPSYINAKGRGPTPPNVYDLTLREQPFHGVRAIRLNPVDESKMFGRDGILAHTYMLGPNGQSNGCLSFNNYNAFLTAYLSGEVTRLLVVDHFGSTPAPQPASQWFADTIKDLLGRS
jgi:hypothetical protein